MLLSLFTWLIGPGIRRPHSLVFQYELRTVTGMSNSPRDFSQSSSLSHSVSIVVISGRENSCSWNNSDNRKDHLPSHCFVFSYLLAAGATDSPPISQPRGWTSFITYGFETATPHWSFPLFLPRMEGWLPSIYYSEKKIHRISFSIGKRYFILPLSGLTDEAKIRKSIISLRSKDSASFLSTWGNRRLLTSTGHSL